MQAIFRQCTDTLGNRTLYEEVRDEIREMAQYLDSDSQRRQSNTVVRLTVITILGLIATVTTGYFGMNIIPFADEPFSTKLLHGGIALSVCTVLILFGVTRSKRLSDVLEILSDERLRPAAKLREALAALFGERRN